MALPESLPATREAWHRLAEHVLAAAQYAATGDIGLVPAPGGFATHQRLTEPARDIPRNEVLITGPPTAPMQTCTMCCVGCSMPAPRT